MSEEERQKAFLQGLAVLCQRHGMNLEVSIKTEYLGDAVLSRPKLSVIPIPGWQPPAEAENPNE
jgi:hypothetical protein